MLCIYYPINFNVKNGKVDEEHMRLLTSYTDACCKHSRKTSKRLQISDLGIKKFFKEDFNI
jgi:hypothetical protein